MQSFEMWVRSRDLPSLKGQQVQLIPYAPDVIPEDILVHAWRQFRADGTLQRLFWHNPTATSLKDFLGYWDYKALFLVMTHEPKMLGLVWLADIVRWHRAEVGIAMYRHLQQAGIANPPALSREALWLLVEWATQVQKLTHLWMRSPWREARRLARACGALPCGRMPGYHLWQGTAYDVELWALIRPKEG